MEIKIDLSNPNSVKRAIQALQRAKTTLLDKVVEELANECANAIRERANERLYDDADIGIELKQEIAGGWVFSGSGGKYILSNLSDKSVYVEFGVGVTGKENPHPNAPHAKSGGYKYDMTGKPRNYKLEDRSWIFRVNDIDLVDIGEQYVMTRPNGEKFYESGKTIRTKGQPAIMYLYNGIMDFMEKDAQDIWSKISLKYFG